MDEREKLTLDLLREALDLDAENQLEFVSPRCSEDPEMHDRIRAMLARIAIEERGQPPRVGIGPDRATGDIQEPGEDHFSSADSLLGETLGPFRIIERIGRGGMGVVYRGERTGADFNQNVAIKVIRRGFDFDDVHARFLRERRILARLNHPHLARFIDGGLAADGRPWFALEYVSGKSITRWCDTRRLGVKDRVRLFLDVCAAVQYAHTQLVIHRDLKPANILVDAAGSVRLVDFGVAGLLSGDESAAAITATGVQPAMTPAYAAPEQFDDSEVVGVSADVYSLGVVLYELVTGVLPFAIDYRSRSEVERAVRQLPPPALSQAITRLDDLSPMRSTAQSTGIATRLENRTTSLRSFRREVRGDFTRIVETALAKEKERRYPTAQAFADDLQRWLAGKPVPVVGNGLKYRVGKFVQRNRTSVGIAAVLSLGLVATTVIALQTAVSERRQREAAVAEAERSNAVREYLTLMFRSATEKQSDGAVTAESVLKQGAADIFERFRDQPRTGQTTALMLSELYAALGDPKGAEPLLARLLEWPGIEANPEVLASARLAMATTEHQLGRDDEARAHLAAAQAFWSSRPERFLAKLGASRTLQARLERQQGNIEAAIATIEQSIQEFRSVRAGPDGDVAYALVTLSITLAQAGRVEQALKEADVSVAEYKGLGQADSVDGLTALGNRAAIATMLGQNDRALADMREVSAKLTVHGSSEALAKANAQLGELLAKLERFEEALPLLRDSLANATHSGGPDGRLTAGIRQRLAQACLDAGRLDEAAPLIEQALDYGKRISGEKSRDTGIAYRQRAQLRVAQSHPDEALADLLAAQGIFEAMGTAGARQILMIEKLRAQIQSGAPLTPVKAIKAAAD